MGLSPGLARLTARTGGLSFWGSEAVARRGHVRHRRAAAGQAYASSSVARYSLITTRGSDHTRRVTMNDFPKTLLSCFVLLTAAAAACNAGVVVDNPPGTGGGGSTGAGGAWPTPTSTTRSSTNGWTGTTISTTTRPTGSSSTSGYVSSSSTTGWLSSTTTSGWVSTSSRRRAAGT